MLSGGIEDVSAGALASGTTIRGGLEYVFSGGTASGTVLSAGTLEIASGGSTGAGPVTFSGGGTLHLDDSIHFGGLVAGFAVPDVMDLADIPFVSSGASGATTVNWNQITSGATGSGTLTVAQGTHSANLTLLGNYVTGNFHLLTDGASGTIVTDPPVTAQTDPGPFALLVPHQG